MSLVTYFSIVWILVVTYVVVGLYVHTRKILPKLREVHGHAVMPLMPSKQLSQIDEYLKILDEAGERPWYYLYLRHIRKIISALLLMMVPIFLEFAGALD